MTHASSPTGQRGSEADKSPVLWAIRPDDEGRRFVSPHFSFQQDVRTRWRTEPWSPYVDLQETADRRLTKADRERLQALTIQINTTRKSEINVAGVYGLTPSHFMVVSGSIARAITELDPDAFEFVPIPKVYNLADGGYPVVGADFHFARPLCIADALDKEASDLDHQISELRGAFPRAVNGPRRVFDPRRIPPRHFWRDATTGEGICTGAFRAAVEHVGCSGWLFYHCHCPAPVDEPRKSTWALGWPHWTGTG